MLSLTKARRPTRVGIGGACLAVVGLVLAILGTFLPWVRSGMVLRDSYESIGVMRRIDVLDDSPLELVLTGWIAIIPVVTLCVVVYIVGFRRTAAVVSTIVAIFCGTIAGIATVVSGGDEVLGIDSTGPNVTLIGSVLALLGSVGVVIGQRRSATENPGGEP